LSLAAWIASCSALFGRACEYYSMLLANSDRAFMPLRNCLVSRTAPQTGVPNGVLGQRSAGALSPSKTMRR
jgi:hypothetical protein